MTNPNDPAFADGNKRGELTWGWGLTKREYFAAMAMSGVSVWDVLMNKADIAHAGNTPTMARSCVQFADDLISALNKDAKP